jgi:hypothetical protein
VYGSREELQADLDVWLREYNDSRPHQGRWCFGKTPDADLPRRNADDEGENDRSLTASDTKPDRSVGPGRAETGSSEEGQASSGEGHAAGRETEDGMNKCPLRINLAADEAQETT